MSVLFQKAPPQFQYVVGQANIVDYELVPVIVTGVAADTPTQDLILPGRTFVQDGQVVTMTSLLSTTSLAGGATILLRLNGTTVFNTNPSVGAGSAAFKIVTELIRIGATSLNVISLICAGISVVTPPIANGVFSGSFLKLTGIDFASQITLAWSAAVPTGGQNITQELCYCSIL